MRQRPGEGIHSRIYRCAVSAASKHELKRRLSNTTRGDACEVVIAREQALLSTSLAAAKQAQQFLEALIRGFSGRCQLQVRLAIERLTGLEDILELAHGFAAARHRPKIALIDDSLHVFFRRGTNPDGD